MQRSSDSIAAIAGALAKAQIELANPEKSLLATIRSPFPGRPIELSGTLRLQVGSTLSAKCLANMKSPLCRPLKSTGKLR